jgi:agarase
VSIARTTSHHTRRSVGASGAGAPWGRFLVVLGVASIALLPAVSAQAAGPPARSGAVDLHGHTMGRSRALPATGYFTTVHEHGHWYFVTPTGQPFFSTGVDHVASDPDTDQSTGQCPYCETIHSQYPSTAAWESATVAQLRSWGFNSLGPFSDDSEFAGQMPYTVQLSMASGDDWFAPSFVTNADEVAATQVAPLADDPDLIGWYTDSELTWGPTISNENTELQDYLALPAGSPGLAVAQQYEGRPNAFLYALATRYFQVTSAAIRMYDTHHLILGVKAEGQYIQPQLLEAAGHYVSVFSIDDYALLPGYADGIHALWPQYLRVTANFSNFEKYARIPIMVAEYSFIGETPQTPDTVPGVYAVYATQAERALAYAKYMAPLYENAPWVVGDEWFEYVDEPQGGRVADGENNNFGLVNVENQPYEDLVTQMEIMHSIAPDRLAQSGTMCDAWARSGSGVVCSATMPRVVYPLAILGTVLASGTQGQGYHDLVVAEGGRPRYTYRIQQGALPRGLHLNRATGAVSGVPRESGSYTFTVEVTDSTATEPESTTQTLSLDVAPRS